jgi:dienelactone hydrolase
LKPASPLGSTHRHHVWYLFVDASSGGVMRRLLFSFIVLLSATAFNAEAQIAGPQGDPQGRLREQVVLVPFAPNGNAASGQFLYTLLYRPQGNGPFPLAVINHGSPRHADGRKGYVARFSAATAWFIERGFAVAVPMRRGYGPSGGVWAEDYGGCRNGDYYNAGLRSADDIKSTVLYLREQSFIDRNRVVLVGQSAGGWAVLASANQNFPGVVGLINFAGGRGSRGPNDVCLSANLVRAAERYGRGVSLRSLWVYSANDSFFGPSLAREMFQAFSAGNPGRATFVPMPAFREDGHGLFRDDNGPAIWGAPVEAFLREVALAR